MASRLPDDFTEAREKERAPKLNCHVDMKPTIFALVLGLAVAGCSAHDDNGVVASLDPAKVAAAGMKTAQTNTVTDFTVTHLTGPKEGEEIGLYEGGHPGLLSTGKKLSREIKDTIAGQPVTWLCWSEEDDGALSYNAEVIFESKRLKLGGQAAYVEKYHVFMSRSDPGALEEARKLASGLFKQGSARR